eukprot:COSAG02_NODE_45583_length_355_cov_215.917969_1_plen_45_part_10
MRGRGFAGRAPVRAWRQEISAMQPAPAPATTATPKTRKPRAAVED